MQTWSVNLECKSSMIQVIFENIFEGLLQVANLPIQNDAKNL